MHNYSPKVKKIIMDIGRKYTLVNPQRFNEEEKKNFLTYLNEYINDINPDPFESIRDEVFDFYVDMELAKNDPRHYDFLNFIKKTFTPQTHRRVLEVGAGRLCVLSTELAKLGFKVTAQDPNIRLSDDEAHERNIILRKTNFLCDEFSGDEQPTNIDKFHLVIGHCPCLGAEHIIRQCLKYNKPFAIDLCYENHSALNGTKFSTPEEWYKYLGNIADGISIIKIDNQYIISNHIENIHNDENPELN